MQNMTGKVAVVTGGASGIGLGMARAFAGAGMKLVLADLDDAARDAAVAEFRAADVEAVGLRCDVSVHEQVQSLAKLATDTFGGVHVLCNNAGIGIPTATFPMKLSDWRWILDVDLYGPIYGVEVFLPIMEAQGEGHINSTSSMAGLFAGGFMGAYNVAKHGVVALMATLARDLHGRKSPVTASVLCPGSDQHEHQPAFGGVSPGAREAHGGQCRCRPCGGRHSEDARRARYGSGRGRPSGAQRDTRRQVLDSHAPQHGEDRHQAGCGARGRSVADGDRALKGKEALSLLGRHRVEAHHMTM